MFFVCGIYIILCYFFFSSRRRHTRCLSDWSSDVCSSDLAPWSFWRSVRALRFTPDGAALLVGGGPRTLRLFDAATRKETAVLWESPAPQAQAMVAAPQVAVAPDSKQNGAPAQVKEKTTPQSAPQPRELPEQLDIQFSDGLGAHPDLHFFGRDATVLTKVESQGLRITLPVERNDFGDVGVESQKILRGDFEITLAYELIAVPKPGPAGGAGAVL